MKTKLLLSILLFGTLLQTKAQDVLQEMKPRPADYEYLSAPDSLGVRHQLLMPNISNRNTQAAQNLPYPIIFVHGLNSNELIWGNADPNANLIHNTLQSFGLTFGGRFDYNLNFDGQNGTANKLFWPTINADLAAYTSTATAGDYYFVNFDVGSNGTVHPVNTDVLSNQSAIAKQGIALKDVIQRVLNLTQRDKVILMGHSMGGLATREYLQNPENWTDSYINHHIAKLVTTGTPHGGSNAAGPDLSLISSILPDPQTEAVRDLRTSYSWSSNPGVFLYGGIESQNVMNDFSLALNNFYNFDVNCNGVISENIRGLNQKNPQYNIDYSCIIGTGLSYGDGVVSDTSANINNVATFNSAYSNLTQNIFYCPVIHTSLTSQSYKNMQGLDEPNYYNLAYGIDFVKNYTGFITEQSVLGSTDWDDYKFTISNTSNVSITINTPSAVNLNAKIVDSDYSQVGSIHSNNGTGNITFSQNNLPTGNYFFVIFADPVSTSYSNYNFSLSKISTPVSPIVISQVYGGGGNSGAPFTNDYIELFNRGTIAQNLNGWSVQYVPATAPTAGLTWFTIPLPNFTLQPGQYFLIKCAAGTTASAALPLEDAIDTTITLSSTAGKVILVSNTTPETSINPTGSQIIDKVGYGTTPNGYEGSGPTGTLLSNTTAAFRKLNGCTDTDSNTNDFSVGAPTPRNSSSPINDCSSSLSVSQNTIATVAVYPNPTHSKVFFDNTNSNFKEVAVYNYLGQEVSKTAFTSISNNQEVDMSGLSAGVYILKFSDSETSQSVKVVKQ
jgi:pimeloyl-ACP methyl ester carboxylesterase